LRRPAKQIFKQSVSQDFPQTGVSIMSTVYALSFFALRMANERRQAEWQ
jgi:hypothetical protein